MNLKTFFSTTLLLLITSLAWGQQNITGKVISVAGEPLPGVHIVVKNTAHGVVSDLDGNYSIDIKEESPVLVFSFVGFEEQEIKVQGRTQINVQLKEGEELSEVVVIGYGTVRKSDLTGSVASISSKDLQKLAPSASVDALFDGKIAGVQIQRTDGAPGGNVNVNIRGVSSVTGGNQPLYIIDGFPYIPGGNSNGTKQTSGSYNSTNLASSATNRLNPLSFINQNDIESVQVLKDASATAIYGSRGANGVIIITTKRGKQGQSEINFEFSKGVQQLVRKVDMMNGSQYAEFVRDGRNNAYLLGGGDRSPDDPNSVRPGSQRFPDIYRDPSAVQTVVDWQDEVYRTADIDNYQLSFSGGTEKVRYLLSGSYMNQEGIIKTSGFEKFTARVNLDAELRPNVSVGLSFNAYKTEGSYARTDGHYGRRNVVTAALAANPTIPVYDKNGDYTQLYEFESFENPPFPYSEGMINPVLILDAFSDIRKSYGAFLNSYLEWKITKDLYLKTTIGTNLTQGITRLWKSSEIGQWSLAPTPATAASHSTSSYDWLNENTLSYKKSFGNHNLNVVGGLSVQKSTTDFISAAATDFGNDNVPYITAGIVNAGMHTVSEWGLISVLGRGSYNYAGKYYLTATVRSDGSSRFGQDNRWGTFPSFAVAYRISEEAFMKEFNHISNLKLRLSYGISGNNQIGNYSSIGLLRAENYVVGGSVTSGLIPSSLANPALSWEESKQINAGFDLGLYKDRINLSADIFKDIKRSMLFQVPMPAITGFNSSVQNRGEVENKGLELDLGARIIAQNNFSWNASLNMSFIRNKVLKLSNGEDIFGQGTSNITITREDYPISSFYGRQVVGIFQSQEEIDNSPFQHNNTRPGDLKFANLNDDDIINNDDQTIIGDPWADYTFGLNNSFFYKNFSLNVQITGSQGNEIYAWWGQTIMNSAGVQNQWVGVDERWKSPDDPGAGLVPRAVRNGGNGNWKSSSRFVFDASYVRINNIRLSYRLPSTVLERLNMSNITLYTNVNNLYTFTDYPGYNPSASSGGNDLRAMGFDQGNYPLSKSYIFGLQLSF